MAKRPFTNTDAGRPRNEGPKSKRLKTDEHARSIKRKGNTAHPVYETIHSARQLEGLFADYANAERIQDGAATSPSLMAECQLLTDHRRKLGVQTLKRFLWSCSEESPENEGNQEENLGILLQYLESQ